jgi:pimeloyl-ACP methyl ester carboxylesterase
MAIRDVSLRNDLTISIEEVVPNRVALVLHGGGGPKTVALLAAHLAKQLPTVTPTHPGWEGKPRPDDLDSIPALAEAYLDLLELEGFEDVVLVGSSLGGWIAAEMAVRSGRSGRVGVLVLVDAVGIEVPGQPMTDFFALDPRGIVEHSFHDPDRFYVDPATLPPEALAAQAANVATMKVLAGDPYMHDPTLRGRLGEIAVPTQVIWGDSDGIVTPGYGRAFAAGIPDAFFELVADAGHLPQLEQPAATFELIDTFLP